MGVMHRSGGGSRASSASAMSTCHFATTTLGGSVIAFVGPPEENTFPIAFQRFDDGSDPVVARALAETGAELDHYLLDVGLPDMTRTSWIALLYESVANCESRKQPSCSSAVLRDELGHALPVVDARGGVGGVFVQSLV